MNNLTYKYERSEDREHKEMSFETFLRIAEMKKYRKMLEKRIKAQHIRQR